MKVAAITLSLLTALSVCARAQAQTPPPDDSWRWEVSAYLLGASLDGTTGIGPVTADINLSFGDILDNLEFGFMGRARATHGVWSFGTDIIYMGLGGSTDSLDVDVDQWAVEFNIGFNYSEKFTSLIGARYNQVSATIAGPLGRTPSGKVDWWDPLVGGIATVPLGEHWNMQFHGDIGGFGVGSDFTWQAELLFNWFVSERTSIMLGARYIDMDYDDNGFVYKVVTAGPQIGLTMRF